ncbi:MAG: hypothetical protein ACLFT0_12565 [Spirulinaceae cyanobacterium]
MTGIELLQIISPLVAFGGILFRVGVYTSKIDQKIMKVEGSLLAKISELRSELLLKQKDLSNNQNIDDYKFTSHERQLKDIHSHLRDVERTLEKTIGYARKPYATFEDTQARRRLPDGSWLEYEGDQ